MLKIKSKSLFVFFLTIALIFSLATVAIAKQNQNQGQNNTNTNNATSEEDDDEEDATSTKGQLNAAAHRSVVANFVQSLLSVADREQGGIGEQVREVARQQNQSEATTTEAITKVNSRGKIKTFLIGSDYKNLGALRSEVVHTRNRIEQLNRIMANIQNASDTAEIQAQIQTLEQEQTRVENFIKEKESKFSLFGWLLRLFNR